MDSQRAVPGAGSSRNGYYQWRAAAPLSAPAWQPAAQQTFTRHAKCYGTCRLHADRRPLGGPLRATQLAAG
jgi:hypothetical protein